MHPDLWQLGSHATSKTEARWQNYVSIFVEITISPIFAAELKVKINTENSNE